MSDPTAGKDQVFAAPMDAIHGFEFDESVASVFEDMIRRSVPGYGMTLSLMPLIAKRYAQPETRVYDLGCSLGAGLLSIAPALPPSSELIGIDNSESMLGRCRSNLKSASLAQPWSLECRDILETPIERASVVLLNFTLQFVPVAARADLLKRIATGLQPGGVLLLSEKVRFSDADAHRDLFELHHAFKKANGYSDLEVSQKRAALENVLVPETIGEHKDRLAQAGFDHCEVWLQCFNFASLIAVKGQRETGQG